MPGGTAGGLRHKRRASPTLHRTCKRLSKCHSTPIHLVAVDPVAVRKVAGRIDTIDAMQTLSTKEWLGVGLRLDEHTIVTLVSGSGHGVRQQLPANAVALMAWIDVQAMQQWAGLPPRLVARNGRLPSGCQVMTTCSITALIAARSASVAGRNRTAVMTDDQRYLIRRRRPSMSVTTSRSVLPSSAVPTITALPETGSHCRSGNARGGPAQKHSSSK